MKVPIVEDKVKGHTTRSWHISLDEMDAIACGVEAKYELITGHSRIIIEETVAVARKLGVLESKIEKWLTSRLNSDIEKVRMIESLLKSMQ